MTVSHSADRRSLRTRPGEAGALPLAGVVVAATAVAALANPDTIEDGPVICPFRLMTGLPCPGCGLTRAWVYLVHGRLEESLSANPFGMISFALGVALVVMVVRALVRRRPLPDLARVLRSPAFYALGAVWAVFGVVRLVAEVVAG